MFSRSIGLIRFAVLRGLHAFYIFVKLIKLINNIEDAVSMKDATSVRKLMKANPLNVSFIIFFLRLTVLRFLSKVQQKKRLRRGAFLIHFFPSANTLT